MSDPIETHVDPAAELGMLRARVAELEREREQHAKTQQALQRSEERFRLLAEHIPGVIYLCQNDERYSMLYLNDEVERLTGYPKEDFLDQSRSFVDLYHPEDADDIAPAVDAALSARRPFELVYRIKHRDGTWRWVHEVGVGVFRDDALAYLEGFLTDITDRTLTERRLLASEQQTHQLFDAIQDGVVLLNLDGEVVECNNAFPAMHGLTRQELFDRPFKSIIDEESLPKFDAFLRSLRAGQHFYTEAVDLRADGSRFDIEVHGWPFRFLGEPSILAIVRDITDRKEVEAALRKSEQRYQTLATLTPSGIFHTDHEGRCTYINDHLGELMGLTLESAKGFGWADSVHADDREDVISHWRETVGEGRPFRHEFRLGSGGDTPRWVLARATPQLDADGKPVGFVGAVTDITDHKKAMSRLKRSRDRLETEVEQHSEALRESESRFSTMLGNIPGVVYRCACDEHWTMRFISDRVETLVGYPASDFIDNTVRTYASVIHPDDCGKVTRGVLAAIDRQRHYDLEYRVIHRDGTVRWVYETGQGIFGDVGQLLYLDGAIIDVTAHKRAEQELERIFDLSLEMLCIAGFDGRFKRVNPAMTKTLGYDEHELLSRPFLDFVHPDDREATVREMEALSEGKPTIHFENRYLCKDGSTRTLAWMAMPVTDEGVIYATARDMTTVREANERARKLQSELAHVGRLSTMGEMATTLAHELNQPLYALCNFIQGCILRMESGTIEQGQMLDTFRQIMQQAERAANIIRRVRAFTRKRPVVPVEFDINHAVEEVRALLAAEAQAHDVKLVLELEEPTSAIVADRIQIEQVLINLARNGIESIAESDPATRRVTIRTRSADEGVQIDVIDTGGGLRGISADELFEPFQTTKPNGIGMGLSISRSIVEAHGGQLTMSCDGDLGMVFSVAIPSRFAVIAGQGGIGM